MWSKMFAERNIKIDLVYWTVYLQSCVTEENLNLIWREYLVSDWIGKQVRAQIYSQNIKGQLKAKGEGFVER